MRFPERVGTKAMAVDLSHGGRPGTAREYEP